MPCWGSKLAVPTCELHQLNVVHTTLILLYYCSYVYCRCYVLYIFIYIIIKQVILESIRLKCFSEVCIYIYIYLKILYCKDLILFPLINQIIILI